VESIKGKESSISSSRFFVHKPIDAEKDDQMHSGDFDCMKWKKRRENIYDKAEGKVCQSKK
jgi:hypothetical protein